MATLRDLAQKKTPAATVPPVQPAAPRQMILTAREPVKVEGKPLPTRPAEPWAPSVPGAAERLLGTENRSDVIPYFLPNGDGATKEWEAASLLPASSLGIVLGISTGRAWLACSRPGMPPLLILPLPVLGTLKETGTILQVEPLPPSSGDP